MMRYLFYLMLISLTYGQVQAQELTLKGTITEATTNKAISNANIDLSGERFTTSDAAGSFSFSGIQPGEYTLRITHINYAVKQAALSVTRDTSVSVKMIPSEVELQDIVINASKFAKDIFEVPYSAELVTGKQIERDPGLAVPDLLDARPGISLLREGAWGSEISIRGLSRENVVTLVDGNRLETATSISARLSMVDMNDIERIEVIKGAASSLYGSGATGGIVNIITKSGSYADEFTLSGSYSGGYQSVNNYLSNGINLFARSESVIAKISASHRKADDTETPAGTLQNSQFEDYSVSALLSVKTFENHELTLNFQQFKAEDVGIPGGGGLFPSQADIRYPEERRQMLSAEYSIKQITPTFNKFSVKYFAQEIYRDVENIPHIVNTVPGNGGPTKKVNVLSILPSATHSMHGAQLQTDFAFSGHYLIAGIDFWNRSYDGQRTKNIRVDVLGPDNETVVNQISQVVFEKPLPNSTFNSAGLFVQDEFSPAKNLTLTLGGRFDYIWLNNDETMNPVYLEVNGNRNYSPPNQTVIWEEEEAENTSWTLNAGAVYQLNAVWNLHLNAARSFRSPSLEERYQYIDLGSVVRVGNPDLAPEQGYFFDLGTRARWMGGSASASVFLNMLKDLVTEEVGTYDGRNALITTNIGEAMLYGFELEGNMMLSRMFSAYGSVSFVKGRDTRNEEDLPQIPPVNGRLGVSVNPEGYGAFDLYSRFALEQSSVAPGEVETPGYATLNAAYTIDSINIGIAGLRFTAGIENIFDQEYRRHLSTNRGLIGWEPGRNFYLQLGVNW